MSDGINLKCSRCGGTQFEFPKNPQANDTVKCAGCGAAGRWGDLQKQAVEQAKKEVEKVFKDAFKKWR